MGTGSGAGVGKGKGVKGGWRVNAFLLLLMGWQAVLLPWAPLILKDAGFSATSVGLLSGGTTLAASVGVVACLRAMRRSRSGAVRRLLLWLLFAGATLLQGCGVVLLLLYIPHTGLLQSCVTGWSFAPTTTVFPQNVSSPLAVSSLHPQSLAPKVNTTTTSTNITQTHIPSISISTSAITTTSTSTTVPPNHFSSIPPNTTTTTVPNAATTATSTSRASHITVPAVKITQRINDTLPVNTSTNTVQSLTSDNPQGSGEEHPKGGEEGTIGTGGATIKAQPMPPLTKGKFKNGSKNKVKSTDKNFQHSLVSFDNSGRDKPHQVLSKNKNKSSQDNDPLTSQNHLDDETSQNLDKNDSSEDDEYEDDTPQDENENDSSEDDEYEDDTPQDENDSSEDDEDEMDIANYEDISPQQNSHSRVDGKPGNPSRGFQNDMRDGDAARPWKSQSRRPHNRNEATALKHPFSNLFTSKKINLNGNSAMFMNDQIDTRPRLTPSPSHYFLSPRIGAQHPHHPARPLHPAFSSRGEGVVQDLTGGDWNYDGSDGQIRSHPAKYRRIRRSIQHTDDRDRAPPSKTNANESVPHQNETFISKWNPVKGVENISLMVGVAMLLALGGFLGAGVEASVAQLWHCYVYGYDEGGVSQDVLQRTITHTFHLSTYGSHKSWTGITSGGWAMMAGVMSILGCLAGTGGSGYGGLLGVYLALGLASLLFLLILPVPYGSIDPPRTRRPLSLYLDDEVLREGVRRLTFHLWVFVNGCLVSLSLTFSLWLLQEMTMEGWVVGSQAAAVGITLMCESLALHTQRRLVTRLGLHGLMGVCGINLMLHYGVMWASENVGLVVVAHVGLGVAIAFLWVAVKHNALLLATVSDQEREAWASWWCWRFGLGVGAAVWSVGVSGAGGKVRPLLLPAALIAATLAAVLCMTAVLAKRHSRTRRRVYHTLDLDMADEEDDVDEDAAEDDWLVKRARKEGITL